MWATGPEQKCCTLDKPFGPGAHGRRLVDDRAGKNGSCRATARSSGPHCEQSKQPRRADSGGGRQRPPASGHPCGQPNPRTPAVTVYMNAALRIVPTHSAKISFSGKQKNFSRRGKKNRARNKLYAAPSQSQFPLEFALAPRATRGHASGNDCARETPSSARCALCQAHLSTWGLYDHSRPVHVMGQRRLEAWASVFDGALNHATNEPEARSGSSKKRMSNSLFPCQTSMRWAAFFCDFKAFPFLGDMDQTNTVDIRESGKRE